MKTFLGQQSTYTLKISEIKNCSLQWVAKPISVTKIFKTAM